ncbi:MAG TPA: hypothetical protein PLU10_09555, partial [Chitinophagaceae bacterium]|nr:hypothetical protein [Chitinophagaceae bacterium]
MKKVLILLLGIISLKSMAYTPQQERLLNFIKVYSTVKYYYPDPNLKEFNWYALALRGYKLAYDSKNDIDYFNDMKSLFSVVGPGVQITKDNYKPVNLPASKNFSSNTYWQHKGGLSNLMPSYLATSTINYLYSLPARNYVLFQPFMPSKLGITGKKIRVSFWAKNESAQNTNNVFQLNPICKQTTPPKISINVTSRDWKLYSIEVDYPADAMSDRVQFNFPKTDAVYIDNFNFEVSDSNKWRNVDIKNTDFEEYTNNGLLQYWEDGYSIGNLAKKESVQKKSGQASLKLASIEENKFYAVANQPFDIPMQNGYHAYIPLTLASNGTEVFPTNDEETLDRLNKELVKDIDSASSLEMQTITYGIESYAQLLQDYPYKDANFESRIGSKLVNVIESIRDGKLANPWTNLYMDYLLWVNDPQINFVQTRPDTRNKVRLPFQAKLTNHQLIVEKYALGDNKLQAGDVIVGMNQLNIDSLFSLYHQEKISLFVQDVVKRKLMTDYFDNEIELTIKRDNSTLKAKFSKDQNAVGMRPKVTDSLEQEAHEKMTDKYRSDMKSASTLYINSNEKSVSNLLGRDEKRNAQVIDSLVSEMNKYKKVIIDFRMAGNSQLLEKLVEHCKQIDFSQKIDMQKSSLLPISTFNYENINLTNHQFRAPALQAKIILLVDGNCRGAIERNLWR